jgi:hypothetical protein
MDWGVVLILTAFIAGYGGVCLMAAAFALVALHGGWRQAMQSGPDGRWSFPRRLMFAGALLGAVCGGAVVIWMTGLAVVLLAVVLPAFVAVWYFIIRLGFASSRGHHSE